MEPKSNSKERKEIVNVKKYSTLEISEDNVEKQVTQKENT